MKAPSLLVGMVLADNLDTNTPPFVTIDRAPPNPADQHDHDLSWLRLRDSGAAEWSARDHFRVVRKYAGMLICQLPVGVRQAALDRRAGGVKRDDDVVTADTRA